MEDLQSELRGGPNSAARPQGRPFKNLLKRFVALELIRATPDSHWNPRIGIDLLSLPSVDRRAGCPNTPPAIHSLISEAEEAVRRCRLLIAPHFVCCSDMPV